jgi:C-terminal processing protease CtpA/Prc
VSPINYSKEIPRSYTLKRSDSYDGLGIAIAANSESHSNHFIREVEPGSPGDQAGLRKNDRIISVNGINVENVDFTNVLILIKQALDNDNLQLSVIHEPETN